MFLGFLHMQHTLLTHSMRYTPFIISNPFFMQFNSKLGYLFSKQLIYHFTKLYISFPSFIFIYRSFAYFPSLPEGSKIHEDLHYHILRNGECGSGYMAQLIKCLILKHHDLYLELQHPHKMAGRGGMNLNSSTVKGRNKQSSDVIG